MILAIISIHLPTLPIQIVISFVSYTPLVIEYNKIPVSILFDRISFHDLKKKLYKTLQIFS